MLTEAMKTAVRDYYTRISTALPGFRSRRGQREMIAAISNGLGRARMNEDEPANGQNIVVVEGRTGVGKTVGYLVPALAMAKTLDKKIIISTGTVALQEQLFGRDIPDLLAHLDRPVSIHLAKGRRRYCCPARLEQMSGDADQDTLAGMDASWDRRPEVAEIRALRDMAARLADKQWSGDRDELNEPVSDDLWNRISTDSHGCTGSRCPQYNACPFQAGRAQMFKADLIVTNHDFVLSCLASGSSLLPDLDKSIIIFDEAHHLPTVAVSRFALDTNLVSSTKWIERAPALLNRVANMVSEPTSGAVLTDTAQSLVKHLTEFAAALRRGEGFSDKGVLRYPFGRLDPGSAEISCTIASLAATLLEKADEIGGLFTEALEKGSVSSISGEVVLRDLGPLMGRLAGLEQFWSAFAASSEPDAEPCARWIQRLDEGREFVAHFSPISAADTLNDFVWSKASAVVLASATLRTLGNFAFFKSKSGLARLTQVEAVSVTSPFDYQNQGELHIPTMRSDPKDAQAHTQEIIAMLPKVLSSCTTGTLALFASRRQMEDVFNGLPEPIKADVLLQGVKSRAALLRDHVDRVSCGRRSILFGLAGLGEGLDLPGKLCEHVIIAKLPFSPPDSPIEEAMSEWIEMNGGKPFYEIFLPFVGLKIIQWTGRLIRGENDFGRITILDRRIVSKAYGRQLIAGLPEFRRVAA